MESCGLLNKSCMAEIFHQDSCAVCQCILRRSSGDLYLGTCRSDSATQIKRREEFPCTAYLTACEALGKQKQQQMVLHGEGNRQCGSALNVAKDREKSEMQRFVKGETHADGPERCFLGSSLYYGGPDELHEIPTGRKEGQNGIEMEVKQLEEAMDPLNLEFTTRGNWWEGSLYY